MQYSTYLGKTRHREAEGQGDVEYRWRARVPGDAGGAADDHQEGRAEDLAEERHQEADLRHLVNPDDVLGRCFQIQSCYFFIAYFVLFYFYQRFFFQIFKIFYKYCV